MDMRPSSLCQYWSPPPIKSPRLENEFLLIPTPPKKQHAQKVREREDDGRWVGDRIIGASPAS